MQSDAESISTSVRVRVQAHAFRSGLGDAEGLTLRAAITSSRASQRIAMMGPNYFPLRHTRQVLTSDSQNGSIYHETSMSRRGGDKEVVHRKKEVP